MLKPLFFLIVFYGFPSMAQDSNKRALIHDDYDSWQSISDFGISDDGQFAFSTINPQVGDGVSILYNLKEGTEIARWSRAFDLKFLPNSGFLVFTVMPSFSEMRSLKLKKEEKIKLPQKQCVLVSLINNKIISLDSLGAISKLKIDFGQTDLNQKKSDIFGILRPSFGKKKPNLSLFLTEALDSNGFYKVDSIGSWENIISWEFSKDRTSKRACYIVVENEKSKIHSLLFNPFSPDSLIDIGAAFNSVAIGNVESDPIYDRLYYTKKIRIDDSFSSLWSVTLDKENTQPFITTSKKIMIAELNSPGLPPGYCPSSTGQIIIEERGLYFYYQRPFLPVEWDDSLTLKEERAKLDIWSWNDKVIQPQQSKRFSSEKEPKYLAFYSFQDKNIRCLGNSDFPNVQYVKNRKHKWLVRYSQKKYERQYSWDIQLPFDVQLVSLIDGDVLDVGTELLLARPPVMNPEGTAIAYYQLDKRLWEVGRIDSAVNKKPVLRKIDVPILKPVWDEEHDSPSFAYPYGSPGWLSSGDLVVYDAYDIWAFNPVNSKLRNLTSAIGRKTETRMRILKLEPNIDKDFYIKKGIDNRDKSITIRTFHEPSKASGIKIFNSDEKKYLTISFGDVKHSGYKRAKWSNSFLFFQENTLSSPDLYSYTFTNDTIFKRDKEIVRLTELNPQQDSFIWPEVKMINYKALGKKLQGLLYTPDIKSNEESLPLIVYFYESYSDRLHDYKTPAPSASTINLSWFVSNGYAVFIPDIIYKKGHPGKSALRCINSGVNAALRFEKRIDPNRIGLQGQSWGGYQAAFVITQTDRYVCAMAGAPVSNMFSAYGGIRYSSGMSRQFQYEKTQSRIGETPWRRFDLYKKNSPVFFANNVKTPLLIMHNDNDGAVPYTQGIELFMGLRRLDKPVWMLVYNGEQHNLKKRANRIDLSKRMGEFFDHYLKYSPKPNWMAKGRPLLEKPIDKN